jgi:ABC-type microcin C transport system permease subunit YejE
MSREDILASLMAQAREQGAELVTLRAIVEEASALATDRVLERLGLGDPGAESDLGELRELLRAWRDAKTSAWKALVEWIIRGALALLLIGIAVRLGAWDQL